MKHDFNFYNLRGGMKIDEEDDELVSINVYSGWAKWVQKYC